MKPLRPMPAALPFAGTVLMAAACTSSAAGQDGAGPQEESNTSGGVLMKEQACFDVRHYGLEMEVFPDKKSIEATLTMTADVVSASREIALHLHPNLTVRSLKAAQGDGALQPAQFKRSGGILFIDSQGLTAKEGDSFRVAVKYGGTPHVAVNPPWDGGFTWSEAGGKPWIATSCQGEGADLWWPCKDHPSDKPDSFDLSFTVPHGLEVATNGRRISEEIRSSLSLNSGDTSKTLTSKWRVTTPIANYSVALNVGPYVKLVDTMTSVAGDEIPIHFWVLPENEEKGWNFVTEIKEHIAHLESVCGPYPFRGDKYGVVETPHLGMEHQSIIAYGNKFRGDPNFDYDWLHHHELAHEWWGNLVTAKDWADFWIHEGIGTYMQPLYLEAKFGREAYDKKMRIDLLRVLNRGPIAPKAPRTTDSIYFSQKGSDAPGIDIYMKGSWVCHSLRWLLGDETFFKVLRSWAYPDPALEKTTDGSAVRFSTTNEIIAIAERVSGQDLGWFFEVYVRSAPLPKLSHSIKDGVLSLEWSAPGGAPFPMPVEVSVDGGLRRIDMPGGKGTVDVGTSKVKVDPGRRVLKERG